MHAAGKTSYGKSVEQTISILKTFSGVSLLFSEITTEYLIRLEMSLWAKRKAPNTIGIHLRNIRMIYNRAIDAGKVSLSSYPFRRFKIKKAPSRDRDLDIEDIKKLKTAKKGRSTQVYKDVGDQTNANLKKIADSLKIPERLSTYYARHSWASVAFNECSASEDIIALALGHASPRKVTAGYIRKKYGQVDIVNRKVIDLLI